MIRAGIDISRKGVRTTEMVPDWARADWKSIRAELRAKNWAGVLNEREHSE